MSKITRISIGRVYNLGNYEHVRYELTAEIGPDDSAAAVVRGLEKIIIGLKPDSIKSLDDLRREVDEIERMQKFSADEWARHHHFSVGTREEVTARYITSHADHVRERHESIARQQKARELFDDLAGAAVWKDAKDSWDVEED